ncbi:DUF899 domain-containing protein [Gracilibacillus salitolerans]|uniref:DUF899 domain-containing protein n=1 Tax=Gracilibacillus salitolerans TaxID=2663022 RepID=A0A5Q2TQ18_9BACI|nr:DUF899 family protein [Gracilibacillus salitolerans]QGH36217.1 DUF899 domain-containing protein [Gracilibacillus salitolerans]
MNHNYRTSALPTVVDRTTWQTKLDELRIREKAHTREGDAIAAARRRLPMVEVDSTIPLIGPDGPITLLETFEGRHQLVAYYQMWHTGRPAAEQCEGCTFSTTHINELSYLNSRDVSYATFCEGPYEESSRYRDFMGWTVPWYSVPEDAVDRLIVDRHFGILVSYLRDGDKVYETYWTTGRGNELMAPSYGLLDLTVYGRQEFWEDSPVGWPQHWGSKGGQFQLGGRPTAQWSRLEAGHSDDLGTSATATDRHCCQDKP